MLVIIIVLSILILISISYLKINIDRTTEGRFVIYYTNFKKQRKIYIL